MLPKQATHWSLRSNLKITNCRNPYPGVFQGFRPTRIDPSRQVSMSAAHMGPLSSIWTRIWPKMSENIKNRPNISQLENVNKNDFPESSLPGVEIVPTPCASILGTIRASHLPYNAKSEK